MMGLKQAFSERASLKQKFGVIGALVIAMTAIPTSLHLLSIEDSVGKIKSEISALEPAKAVMQLIRLTQQHRGFSAKMLAGDAAASQPRAEKKAAIDQAIKAIDANVMPNIDNAPIQSEWNRIKEEWRNLSPRVESKKINGFDSSMLHTHIIDLQIDMNSRMLDAFGLTQTDDPAIYFLVIGAMQEIPELTEALGLARARGSVILLNKDLDPMAHSELKRMTTLATVALKHLQVDLEKAFERRPDFDAALRAIDKETARHVAEVIALSEERIGNSNTLDLPASDYFKTMTKTIDEVYSLSAQTQDVIKRALDERLAEFRRHQLTIAALLLALACACLCAAMSVIGSIIRTVTYGRKVAIQIADGDLTANVQVSSRDELGSLLEQISKMQLSLREVVSGVRNNAEGVALASSELAEGNLDMNKRTEGQVAAVVETASVMNELSTTIQSNAGSALDAAKLAESAQSVVEQGRSSIQTIVGKMNDIHQGSQKIAKIIDVIDGITFQTNILALNAAVEAARAGEQGRGFAVVAAEVRTLAERSSAAAREISTLIGDSVNQVEQGNQFAQEASSQMGTIVESIVQVAALIQEISVASTEQSEGVMHVCKAIEDIDQTTHQNAAKLQQDVAAAQALSNQSADLLNSVAAFKVAPQA